MEAHEHPDLLDDAIAVRIRLENEPMPDKNERRTCGRCNSTHIEILRDNLFWSQYCGFCGSFS